MCYTALMQVVLIILSAGLLGLIIYFAVSSKSSRHLKLAAFIALGLIVLALAVAGFFLITGPDEGTHYIPFPVSQEAQQPQGESGNIIEVLIFFLLFLLFMGFIIGMALRHQRKGGGKGKTPGKPGARK